MADEIGGVSVSVGVDLGPLTKGFQDALKYSQQFEKQAKATFKSAEDSAKALFAEQDRLRAQYVPLVAEQNKLRDSIAEINRAQAAGALNAREAGNAIARAKDEYARAASGVAGAGRQFVTTATQAGGAGRQFGMQIQNAGFQVGDFAVQVASGGGVLRPFIQQFTQLISGFGPAGAVIGAATAIFGALYVAFMDDTRALDRLNDQVTDATKTVKDFASAGAGLKERHEKEAEQVENLARFYNSLTAAMRGYALAKLEVERTKLDEKSLDVRSTVKGATDGFKNLEQTLQTIQHLQDLVNQRAARGGGDFTQQMPQQLVELSTALQRLRSSGLESAEGLAEFYDELVRIRETGGGFGEFTGRINELIDAIQPAAESAKKLAEAQKLNKDAISAANPEVQQQAEFLRNMAAAYAELAQAEGDYDKQRRDTESSNQTFLTSSIDAMQLRAKLIANENTFMGQNTAEMVRRNAQLQATADLVARGVSLSSSLAKQYINESVSLAEANRQLAKRKELMSQTQAIDNEKAAQQDRDRAAARQRGEALINERDKRDFEVPRGMQDQIDLTNKQIELAGKSQREQEKELALFEKRRELQRAGIDLTSEQAKKELELTAVLADRSTTLDQLKEQQRELQQAFERSFDRIGSAITTMFVEGKASALEFKNVLRAVISEIAQEFIKLAAINPLKNAIFGTSSATLGGGGLGGLFSGIGSLFGGGASAGSLAGTAMVPGPSGGMFPMIHTGGIVGNDNLPMKRVANDVFAGAPRFHTGLMPDEFPAILQKGEGVFTRAQMAALGGGGTKVEVIDMRSGGAPIRPEVMTDGRVRVIVRDEIQTAIPGIVDMSAAQVQDRVERGGSYAASFR